GPRFDFANRADQRGYIAIEWWPDDLAAIRYATGRGIIVIEAAGNGAEDLDDAIYDARPAGFPATWVNPFRRAQDSGAILVGAGAPPPGTHGRDHGPDRSRLDFSNYSAIIDAQGWGREVTTCGYGDLQGGDNEDLWYTDTFSGTSSASPIVVGAVGSLQGALRAAGKQLLTPASARQLLRTTGSPQQDAPGRPATQRIGNRPNLRQAFTQLGLVTKPIKETVKDKIEVKENLKGEIKERKELVKEFKDGIKDRKEFKESVKEVKDKDKDIFDHFGNVFRGPGATPEAAAEGSLDARLAALENAVAQLTHFISPELRPDLASSALSQETDLQALSGQLQQQAADAKNMKDQKDVEKLSEY
ncbi:MAG: S8 family serine peptidase, partial [Terrimicrobiaceae bacterium]